MKKIKSIKKNKVQISVLLASMLVAPFLVGACSNSAIEGVEEHSVVYDEIPAATVPSEHSECLETVCGDVIVVPTTGDPILGATVFTSQGCSGCHKVDSDEKLVGPGLLNIFSTASTREVGVSSNDYIYQSIREPSAFIVDTYASPSVMPAFNSSTISEQDMRNLIAYLEELSS